MIWVTGDCHGDWKRFSRDVFFEQDTMTKEDYVIVCGDFGIWHDNTTEWRALNELNERPFTTLFVDGNHENFDRLYSDEFPIAKFHGGWVHKVRDSVLHLKRGNVYELCGKKIFAFGGARSHDIRDGIVEPTDYGSDDDMYDAIKKYRSMGFQFRVNHSSWWSQEMPNEEEMEYGLKTLADNDYKVDYIITHCCPQEIASIFSFGEFEPDKLTTYFNKVSRVTDFRKWFFGHYHDNRMILDKYIMLYDQIIRIV